MSSNVRKEKVSILGPCEQCLSSLMSQYFYQHIIITLRPLSGFSKYKILKVQQVQYVQIVKRKKKYYEQQM